MSNRLRDLPELTGSNLTEWARAVKEAIQTFRGYRGDPRDRALTPRDLTAAGLAALGGVAGGTIIGGGGGGTGGGGTGPVPDLTPPPTPTGLVVTAGLTYLYVSCDTPTYTEGNGHDRTVAYGAKWPTGGTEPIFASAVELFQFQGIYGAYPTDTGSRWKVWIKWRTQDGVLSAAPAGGTNGVEATTGKIGNADLGPLIIEAGNLAAGAVDATKFVSSIEPVTIVLGALPTVLSTRTIFLASDGKLYRWNGTAYIATVPTADLAGTIADAQIAALAASKITGALSNAQIADLAAAKITGTIVSTQIADDAITTPKLFAGAITTAKIAAGAVTANEVAANAITTGKLAAGAVTAAKIEANTITAGQIAANTITAGQIAASTITAAQIAADTITAGQIAAGAITAGKIAANAIAVGSAAIQNGAIVNAMIGDATIDNAKIAGLSAAKLTVGDGTVGGDLKSTTFTAGSGSTPGTGWRLTPAGDFRASGATIYGTIYASAGVFSGQVIVGSSPAISSTTMTGSGAVFNANGTAAIGNSTKNITIAAGGTAYLNGEWVFTSNLGTGAVTTDKIASLNVDKLNAGSLNVGAYIQSTTYSAGTAGWRISADGFAEFGAASIRGQITAAQINTTGLTIGYGAVTGTPTSLAAINGTEGAKLGGIEAGATVGAAWASNLTGRPGELTDGRITTAIDSNGVMISKAKPGLVAAPTTSGLYLGADFMGYYSAGTTSWRTYMDNTGRFYLGGTSGALQWDGSTLTINGNGTFSGALSAATGTFSGALSGATGTFSGSLTVGSSPAVSGTTMTGSGGVINSGGTFALGNSTTNIAFNGTVLKLNGQIVTEANIAFSALSLSTSPSSVTATSTTPDSAHSTTTATASGGTAPYSYVWSVDYSTNDPSGTTGEGFVTGTSGTYGQTCGLGIRGQSDNSEVSALFRCVATDANGRSVSTTMLLTVTRGTLP